ncbi:MAG: SpoIIIAH-like family protein [Massiliimalia sp.]|jgi:stage III sporulation protein AH
MKANFVIGKKQVILSALIVILGGAIYINYAYANQGNGGGITDVVAPTSQTESVADTSTSTDDTAQETDAQAQETAQDETTSDSGKNYGDAQLVNGPVSGSAYFAEAALNKTKARDEAVETVKNILAKTDATEEEINQATAEIVEISKQISDESKIENLIKAKGFEECVVYLDNDNVSVVVQSDGLTAEQAAQIKNIILAECSVAQENISITEVTG